MRAKHGASVFNISLLFLLSLTHSTHLTTADEFRSQVILARESGLSLLNLTSSSAIDLISRDTIPYSVDFFIRRDGVLQLFWTDIKHEKIQSAVLVNSTLSHLAPLDVENVWKIESIAVDWLSGNVYWTVNSRGCIDVAKSDGTKHCTVVENIAKPRALAVDPEEGLLFWSDWSEVSPRIEKSSLAGGDRQVIYHVENKGKYGWLNAITLDRVNKRLYWVDAKSHTIHVSSYNGGDQRILLHDPEYLARPFSLDLIGDKLIWSDSSSLSAVIEGDVKNLPLTSAIFYESPHIVFGVKGLSSTQTQPIWEEDCKLASGGKCSHLCLRHKVGDDRCVCPYGMQLKKDGHTCIVRKTILAVLSHRGKAQKISYYKNPQEPIQEHSSLILKKSAVVQSIAFDNTRNLLIWLDQFDSKLHYNSPKRSGNFSIPPDATSVTISSPTYNSEVYIATGGEFPSIAECSIHTHVCVPIIFENIFNPTNIVFVHNSLVWLDKQNGTQFIERFSLDKKIRETLFTGKHICCVTADSFNQNIYWLEKRELFSLHLRNKEIRMAAVIEEDSKFLNVIDDVIYVKSKLKDVRGFDLKKTEWFTVATAADNVTALASVTISKDDEDSGEVEVVATEETRKEVETPVTGFENKLKMVEYYDCECIHGWCIEDGDRPVCVCHRGFRGRNCELSECDGFCVNGNCSIKNGNPVCSCFDSWTGENCDEPAQPCSRGPCKVDEKKFDDLHSQFRALCFVTVPVIACLTLTTIGLFLLWIRTRHLLQAAVGDNTRNKRPEEKRAWSGMIFVPSLLRTTEDKKALLDDQLNLINTHV